MMWKKCLWFLSCILFVAPVFGQWSLKVSVVDTMMYRVDTSVNVFMSLLVPKDSLRRDLGVHLTPVVYKGDSCLELGTIGVYGAKMRQVLDRERVLAGKKYKSADAFLMRGDSLFTYWVTIARRDWMDTLSLLLEERLDDCCGKVQISERELVTHRLVVKDAPIVEWKKEEVFLVDSLTVESTEEVARPVQVGDTPLVAKKMPPPSPVREKMNVPQMKKGEIYSFSQNPTDMAFAKKTPVSLGEGKKMDVKFLQGKRDIALGYKVNQQYMKNIVEQFDSLFFKYSSQNMKIRVVGTCSPEGPEPVNYRLAKERAFSFCEYMVQHSKLNSSYFEVENKGENWEALRDFVDKSNMPDRIELLNTIDDLMISADQKEKLIKSLSGGLPYQYLLENCFPGLRKIEYKIVIYEK